MNTKRKAAKKPAVKSADAGMAALIEAEQKRIEQDRADFEAKWKPFKRKPLVANEESLVATVHRIADLSGAGELTAQQVRNTAEFVSSGQLWVKDGQIMYSLRRAITINEKHRKDFVISEISDRDMAELGVDGFRVGMLIAQGKHDEIEQDDIRAIARGAIKLPQDFAVQLPARELMALYGLYAIFFLGP